MMHPSKFLKSARSFVTVAVALLTLSAVNAQTAAVQNDSSLAILAGIREGEVLLKVVPRNKEAWFFATRKGVNISYALETDKGWSTPVSLTPQPLLPASQAAFDAQGSGYAQAMKNAVYDQNFVPESQAFSDLHQTNKTLSSFAFLYFVMSCYHPDLSELSGLQLKLPENIQGRVRIRVEVEGNKKYVAEQIIHTGQLYQSIPGPILECEAKDRIVKLNWNHTLNAGQIVAYQIFRSSNGENFEHLGAPVLYNASSDAGKQGMVVSEDSLPTNYEPYWYKVRGYDVFGYLTDETPAVKVVGRDRTPPGHPSHLSVRQTAPNQATLTWQHEPSDDLAGFQVIGCMEELGEYQPLHRTLLATDQRLFQYDLSETFYKYYRIMAVDTAYNASVSDIAYLVEVDTVPPPVPSIASATCDTNRVVTLTWSAPDADDVKGYRVFRAYHPSHGFHPLTPKPLADTTFTDSLSKRLEKRAYYRILALDEHYNHSAQSEAVRVEIPDLIAPTPPLLYKSRLTETGNAQVYWKPSSSADVAHYTVYRVCDDSTFNSRTIVKASELTYTDAEFQQLAARYAVYAVSATDSSGNASERSNVLRLLTPAATTPETARIDSALYNGQAVIIKWPASNVAKGGAVLIYRAGENGSFTLLSRADSGTQFTDNRVKPQSAYLYKLGVIDANGKRWALSEPVEVRTGP